MGDDALQAAALERSRAPRGAPVALRRKRGGTTRRLWHSRERQAIDASKAACSATSGACTMPWETWKPARSRLWSAAVAIASEIGDRRWEGNGHCNLGLLSQEQGKAARKRESNSTSP